NPIENSQRMLLVHLTDVQGSGIRFSDNTRTVILQWGKGTLVQKGAADIILALANAAAYTVYELSTDGSRVRKLPVKVNNGTLEFSVSTDGPDGGRIYYEIVKQ
ncbi:MAG: hypothetical protein IJQ93_06970, partial [Bacteroidales bacterium]|nr:hypothetical protein [Bacteroidales bacterium]